MLVSRRRVLLVAAFSVASSAIAPRAATAQQALVDSIRPSIERAAERGDWGVLDGAAARLRSAVAPGGSGATDAWTLYELGYVLHRRASGHLNEAQGKKARPLLDEADRVLQRAQAAGAGMQALALRGAVNGQIAGSGGMVAGMRNGPRAFSLLDEALKQAPQDARVALLNGMTRLNAPRAFGGGPAKAEPELRRAIALFATDRPAAGAPRWGLVDAHIWLAITLEQAGKMAEARAELARALEISPGHAWALSLRQRFDASRQRDPDAAT